VYSLLATLSQNPILNALALCWSRGVQTGWSDALPRSWLDGLFAELCVKSRPLHGPEHRLSIAEAPRDQVLRSSIDGVEVERIVNCVTEAISYSTVRAPAAFKSSGLRLGYRDIVYTRTDDANRLDLRIAIAVGSKNNCSI
jgi:hypothetical protein